MLPSLSTWTSLHCKMSLFLRQIKTLIWKYILIVLIRHPITTPLTNAQRLGMAYLLGQLGLQQNVQRALDLLQKSAVIADQLGDPETAAPLFVCASSLSPLIGTDARQGA